MGILNLTPDSFFDGGRYNTLEKAVSRAHQMIDEGAAMIDVGGESTRPFSKPVGVQEELDRVIPVIARLSKETPVCLSVDTSKPEVMLAAIQAGATLINDVYALRKPGALDLISRYPVRVCLVHMQNEPDTMQIAPKYTDLIEDIYDFFKQRIRACLEAGLQSGQIILDPGFGFGKSLQANLTLVAQIDRFLSLKCPMLLGVSRKSSIGAVLNVGPEHCLQGSIALAVLAFMHGCSIIRTHDVKPTYQALTMVKHAMMESSAYAYP